MKEKPILFNTEMVKAILEGRKTQTRRVIKDKDIINRFDIDVDGKPIAYINQATGESYKPTDLCRYQPDDILWVRETWAQICNDGEPPYYEYYADTGSRLPGEWPEEEKEYTLLRWRPSIHIAYRNRGNRAT